MYRSTATQPTTITVPSWIREIVDTVCEANGRSRAAFFSTGAKAQVVSGMRIGELERLLTRAIEADMDEPPVSITVTVPGWLADYAQSHCENFGYTVDQFVRVACIKYLAIKEDHDSFWDSLHNECLEGRSRTVKGITS